MGGITGSRRVRAAVGLMVLGVLVADVLAYRSVANRARPVALETVVARYRERKVETPGLAQSPAAPAPTAAAAPVASTAPATPATPQTTRVKVPGRAAAVAPLPPLGLPAPGVYVYATSGQESTNAIGGARHAYPAQTTITVTPSSCGFTMRWDALQQRWDEWTTCVTGRQLGVQAERMKHAFYGISDEREYRCAGAAFRPGPEAAGTPITGQCVGSGETGVWSGKVVGLEPVVVAGKTIAALHVFVQELVDGATTGVRRSDNWFDPQSGLLLRRIATVEGDSSTAAGRVHYTEAVTLNLTSMKPIA